MKKIRFNIKNNTMYVSYKLEDNFMKNINNTNVISDEDLIFDPKYLNNNIELVAGFLRVIIENEHATKVIIEEKELIITSFKLLKYIPSITVMKIKPDVEIDYNMHLEILRNDTLKKIECYSIASYLLERIDTTKSVKIETRSEVFFRSKFTTDNNLVSYSDIFYKKHLELTYLFEENDYKDFETFLSINSNLKSIYFNVINITFLKKIMNYVQKSDRRNLKVSILGIEDNLKEFDKIENYIKKDKYIKNNNLRFRIDYTRQYKLENFLKLLNFTTVRYILIAILLSAAGAYGINMYDLHQSSKQVDDINDNISQLLEEYIEYDEPVIEEENQNSEDTTGEDTNQTQTQENSKPKYVSPYYKDYSQVISVLKNTNPDTVGWLRVNNTTVNYPVVQSTNNSYYLTHDFNKNANSLGWVFMDYRNDAVNLHKNTVIYGHNVAKAKLMFGNLSAALSPSWYKNTSNQYISFNTEGADMKWRIFAIYNIPSTNDYLYNTFDSDEAFLSFVDFLKSRSIYDFGVTVKASDKILTLSTCQNSGKNRLVIHAVLVN